MKLQLDNLIYSTNDQTKIDRLKEYGARVISGEEKSAEKANINMQKETDKDVDFSAYSLEQLRDILGNKKIAFDKKMTRQELLKLLK